MYMNYKRKHRATQRRIRAKERRGKKAATWTYPGHIARELVGRREFRCGLWCNG